MRWNNRVSTALLLSAVLFGGLALAGCDDDVEVTRDPEIRITKGMTWAWRPINLPETLKRGADGRPVVSRDVITPGAPPPAQQFEGNRDWNTEANRTQLQRAIERALGGKGLTQVKNPMTADLLVDYHVAVKTRSARRVYAGYPGVVCGPYGCWSSYGGWGGWGWGPPEVEYIRYHEGAFMLDLALSNPRKLAYRAISRRELNNKRSITPYQAESAINRLLKDLKTQ